MIFRRNYDYALLLALGVICLSSGCCTVAMTAIGQSSDKNASTYKNIPGCQIGSLKPGTQADLFMNYEEIYSGNYLGLNRYSPDEYKKLYNDSISLNPKMKNLLKIDDITEVICDNQPSRKLIFKGFAYKYVDEPSFIKNENLIASYSLLYRSPDNDKISRVPLANLKMIINQDSDTLDGSTIRKFMLSGQLPTIDYAEMKLNLHTVLVQIPKIDSIQTMSRNNSTLTLFLVGLAVDVVFWYYWLHEIGRKAG